MSPKMTFVAAPAGWRIFYVEGPDLASRSMPGWLTSDWIDGEPAGYLVAEATFSDDQGDVDLARHLNYGAAVFVVVGPDDDDDRAVILARLDALAARAETRSA